MNICHGLDEFRPPPAGVVLTIGNFDGVHRGHARLVAEARRLADELNVPVAAVTFDPHPLTVLAPQRAPARLTSLPEKTALLATLGVDTLIVLACGRPLLEQSAASFLAELAARCRPQAIVEGPTFRFGRRREGGIATLRAHADRLGFRVTIVPELHCAELPGQPAINSSAIRTALREGRLTEANTMLGRPYRITGTVSSGDHRGKSLGFPTANLTDIFQLVPAEAVYVAAAQLEQPPLRLAAVNIGPQPTFGQSQTRVEAHLLDYAGELHGQRVGLHLLARLRQQVRFDSSEQLAAQLRRDVEQTRDYADRLAELDSGAAVPL